MNRYLFPFVVALAATSAHATPHVTTTTVSTPGVTVVPFAVPVATPVAVVNTSGVLYSYAPLAANYAPSPSPPAADFATTADTERLWQEFEEFRRWKQSAARLSATPPEKAPPLPPPATLVARTCHQCHAGASAKGGVQLDRPLTPDIQLRSIRAVLAGKMPKGQRLTPNDTGTLLQELAAPAPP